MTPRPRLMIVAVATLLFSACGDAGNNDSDTGSTAAGADSTEPSPPPDTEPVAGNFCDEQGKVFFANPFPSASEASLSSYSEAFRPALAIPFVGESKSDAPPQSQDDVMQMLVKDVVSKVSIDLGNTVQPIEAQVAGGQDNLDRAGDFMEQRLWARAVEELEKTPAFAKPEDESYRQYDLGLVYEAMSVGARGYVLKTDPSTTLLAAVEAVAKHKPFFTTTVSDMMLKGLHEPRANESTRTPLTRREREILQLVAEGKTSRQIATLLDISVKTADTHRANLMRKLDLHSVSELVRYAIHNKVIAP